MAARKKSTADEEKIIELTELIVKGEDAEPRRTQAHVEHDDSDIESLLADMEAGDTASRSAPRQVDANEKLDMSDMGGLDDLFNDFDLPEQPESPSTALDNVVDDLMGMGEKSVPQSGAGASFADELDGLLDEAPQGKSAGSDDLDGSLDSLYASLEEKSVTPEKAAPNPVDSDLDNIFSDLDEPQLSPQKPAPAGPADFPVDLDDLLNGTDEPAPKPRKITPKIDEPTVVQDIPPAPMSEELIQKMPEEMPEKLAQEAKKAEEELSAVLEEIPSPKIQPVMDSQQNFALNANIENLNFQARDLGMRLQNCEADLARTRQRMEGLEKSAANAASIEDLLRDGSPLHTGFAALIATSVGQVIQDARANGPDPQTLNKLHQLEIGSKGAQSRLDAMETRINDLEKESLANGQLAEKLGDLVQDGDNAAQRMDVVESRFEAMLPQIEKSAQLADHYDELLHVSARLSALENSLGQLAGKLEETGAAGENLDKMAQEISVIADQLASQQQKIEELSGNVNSEVLGKMADIEKNLIGRQEEQAKALDEMSANVAVLSSSAGETEKLDALEQKIVELAALRDENLPDRLAALEAQAASALAKAEAAQNGLGKIDLAAALSPLKAGLEQLEETANAKFSVQNDKIGELATRCDALAKTAGEETDARLTQTVSDMAQLREKLELLEKNLANAQSQEALTALESRVAEMDSRVQEEARGTASSFEELTQKIDQFGQASDMDEKLARIESDTQSAKIRVLALEDKFADVAKKDAIAPLENAIHEIDDFAKKSHASLAAQIGELSENQAQLIKNSAELKELADQARKNDEKISAIEERFSQLDLEKALEPLKDEIREIDGKARKIAAQEDTLASHAESLGNLERRLEELSSAAKQNENLAARLTRLENEAKETAPRVLALEGKVDALPGIENVETALLAKIGSVEHEAQTTKENLEILENRLGALEAGKDSESEIHTRLESIANENAAGYKRLEKLEELFNNLEREKQEESGAPSGFEELKQGLESRIENFEKQLRLLEDIAAKTSEIASQIQALDTTAKSVAYRMDAVEARLDNLEPRFNKEIEKAATSVVSRILREEIGRLLTNE